MYKKYVHIFVLLFLITINYVGCDLFFRPKSDPKIKLYNFLHEGAQVPPLMGAEEFINTELKKFEKVKTISSKRGSVELYRAEWFDIHEKKTCYASLYMAKIDGMDDPLFNASLSDTKPTDKEVIELGTGIINWWQMDR